MGEENECNTYTPNIARKNHQLALKAEQIYVRWKSNQNIYPYNSTDVNS